MKTFKGKAISKGGAEGMQAIAMKTKKNDLYGTKGNRKETFQKKQHIFS